MSDDDDAPSRERRIPGVMVGGVAAVAAVSVVVAVAVGGEPDIAEQIARADDAVELEVTDTPFSASRIVYSREVGRVAFSAEGIPAAGEDRIYHLWLIDDGVATSAGSFHPEDGTVSVVLDGIAETGSVVAITVESDESVSEPTGDFLVAQPLP